MYFQLNVEKQSIAKPDDGPLEGALRFTVRLSCQSRLFFNLAKERLEITKRKVERFAFRFLPAKEIEDIWIRLLKHLCGVRVFGIHQYVEQPATLRLNFAVGRSTRAVVIHRKKRNTSQRIHRHYSAIHQNRELTKPLQIESGRLLDWKHLCNGPNQKKKTDDPGPKLFRAAGSQLRNIG